jgi:hypothetical protein
MPEDILRRADALERAKALTAAMPDGWPRRLLPSQDRRCGRKVNRTSSIPCGGK